MTLEFILWIVAWIIASEITFIVGLFKGVCSDEFMNWKSWKAMCFGLGLMFMASEARAPVR